MSTIYTLATWTVRPGHEDEFTALWRELGERTLQAFPDARGTLLRDRSQPNRFVSFGPWDSTEGVTRWRESAPFTETVTKMQQHLADFEPGTYDLVVNVSAT